MKIEIQKISKPYLAESLGLVEEVFSAHYSPEEGRTVRSLVEEIREKRFYVPELELLAVEERAGLVGYAMFSRFPLDGKYENRLLLLSPVAVKEAFQRRHISRDMLEYGFLKAVGMGFHAVLVEGDPQNYRSRGFVTAAEHGILPGKTVHLPAIECLMVKELVPGTLSDIKGTVEYSEYKALQ